MLTVKIISVGNIKEVFLRDAISEYQKRLTRYCKLEVIEVKEGTQKSECEQIRSKLKGTVILCDTRGKLITSEELSEKIAITSQRGSTISFIIGGSHGVGNFLDDVVYEKISLGKITLPHQLFRVILHEQIYRAFTILKGESYHK
ncbi:MAG: 23S rRNA (pseudouridine(1915)-N(3))-methyltransferase RlmH [Firmicutes bacterium]|nr:23S rRNA (pseudouridine(1915)-N(3))-methyltransferase RlmH [Bacillota bacterium]